MGYRPNTSGPLDRSATDPIELFATKDWAILFVLYFGPRMILTILPWFGMTSHQYTVFNEWTNPIACISILIYSIRLGHGSFARLASKRMWATTGTPMMLVSLVSFVTSLIFVSIQVHGIDRAVSPVNLLSFEYRGTYHLFSNPIIWCQTWLSSISQLVMHVWVVILVLSSSDQKLRNTLLTTFVVVGAAFRFATFFVNHLFYHSSGMKGHLPPSSAFWWCIDSVVASAFGWISYCLLERGFRPSLLPVTVLIASDSIYLMLFESPNGLYGFAALVINIVVTWLALRNSRWGVEKWSEYQREREVASAKPIT